MREELEAEVAKLREAEYESVAEGRYIQMETSNDLSSSIQKVDMFLPCFEAMESGSAKLATQLQDCRGLSDRLSLLVRRLDTIQISAQRALACTQDIMSMKDYKSGLEEALAVKQLPKAVKFVQLVNGMDQDAARAADEFDAVKALEGELKKIVKDEFCLAIEGSSVEEVLVLCPLLQSLGLELNARDDFLSFMESNAFIAISADAVSGDNATDASTAYAQALSNVFNTASLILQQYLPGVIQGLEKADGDIHFIRRLHAQAEREAGIVLKRYVKFRDIKEVIASAKAEGAGAEPKASPAEMHVILDELALLLQYCCMYQSYIRALCQSAESRRTDAPKVFEGPTPFDRMVDELTSRYYVVGERWLMCRGVESAVEELDECYFVLQRCGLRAVATNNVAATVTVMHLVTDLVSSDLRKRVTEQLAGAVSQAAAAVQAAVGSAVEDKNGGDLRDGGLDASLRSVISGLQKSTASGGASGSASAISLGEAFNLVGKCVRYTERLNRDVWDACESVFGEQTALKAEDEERLKGCRDAFVASSASFAGILRKGAGVLSMKVQPVVQLVLSTMLDRRGSSGGVRFELKDEVFENQPAVALLPQSLAGLFNMLLKACTNGLGEAHTNLVVEELAGMVCERVEQLVNQSQFSFTGALKFEECVRALQTLFSGYTEGGAVRGIFSRLREILMVLTADSGDGGAGGQASFSSFSKLTTAEAKAIASLRAAN